MLSLLSAVAVVTPGMAAPSAPICSS